MIERIIGVFRLDATTFEDIEHDQAATSQAALIVLAVALLSALGGLVGAIFGDGNLLMAVLGPIATTFIGWVIWAGAVYFIGTNFFEGQADMNELLRVVGFAYAPQLLGFFGFVPCIGWLVALAGLIWSLVAMVVAVRQGLDVDSTQAIVISIVGWVLVLIINLALSAIFGVGGLVVGGIFGG